MTKEISRIELFCDDGSVGRIQRLLIQVKGVYDVKAVPVVNAAVRANGHVKAISGGNMVHQFLSHLMENKITEITPKEVQDWCVKQGRSKLSSSYVMKNLVKAGVVTRRGASSKTGYVMVTRKALPAPKKVKHA